MGEPLSTEWSATGFDELRAEPQARCAQVSRIYSAASGPTPGPASTSAERVARMTPSHRPRPEIAARNFLSPQISMKLACWAPEIPFPARVARTG